MSAIAMLVYMHIMLWNQRQCWVIKNISVFKNWDFVQFLFQIMFLSQCTPNNILSTPEWRLILEALWNVGHFVWQPTRLVQVHHSCTYICLNLWGWHNTYKLKVDRLLGTMNCMQASNRILSLTNNVRNCHVSLHAYNAMEPTPVLSH
jgi:hypothetical protein